ncbi:RICIN domain-containing protein [Janthinobacterium sp.]|uniref:RICIN domain-containing protein n=1 Tax=Janthinobacterium sp. TaxID=1871054 RepID=UPI0025C3F42A|nr:RICIN domain-containing protein [Janthinobacterium sp.]
MNDNGAAKLDILKMTYGDGWPSLTRNFTVASCGGISDGPTVLRSRLSGKALAVAGASTVNGALVQQQTYTGAKHQQWYVVGHGDGYYSLINANSLLGLDDYNNSTTAGTNIAQWSYWSGLGQQWRFASPASGYQTISNRYSNLTLDVLNLSTAENAQIIQWNLTNANNQQWSLSRP